MPQLVAKGEPCPWRVLGLYLVQIAVNEKPVFKIGEHPIKMLLVPSVTEANFVVLDYLDRA